MAKHNWSLPMRSWVDLPHVCESSSWMAFHFRDCQNCFCPLLISSTSTFLISLIPGTFHPRQWPLSSPCCPALKNFSFDSSRLNPALTGKADIRLHQNILSSPLSDILFSKGLSNI